MGILFGLLVTALLAWGLWSRKKQRVSWTKEERYEESGAWLDKRAGERGTFGSLDAEMEQERGHLRLQADAAELSHLIRSYCFGEYSGLGSLDEKSTRKCLDLIKTQAATIIVTIEKVLETSAVPDLPSQPSADEQHTLTLKKKVLAFSFDRFPKLLDLEIETIQKFDAWTAHILAVILVEVNQQKILFPHLPTSKPIGKI